MLAKQLHDSILEIITYVDNYDPMNQHPNDADRATDEIMRLIAKYLCMGCAQNIPLVLSGTAKVLAHQGTDVGLDGEITNMPCEAEAILSRLEEGK